MKSWRTTVLGVSTVMVVIGTAAIALLDGDPATTVDFGLIIAEITAGIGLILARDNKVSSEEAGAK
jgi:hypothetical protein